MSAMFRTALITLTVVVATTSVALAQTTRKKRTIRRDVPYKQLSTGFAMWQEPIEATKGADKTTFMTQSLAARIGMTYNQFYPKSRWRKVYAADALFGTIKGKGSSLTIQDELNKQPWIAVQASAGWTYRTSPASEVGIFAPAILRHIKWDLADGSSLKMDRQTSFSIGLGGVYVNRFTRTQSLHLSVAHQQMWRATVWSATWEQTFH